MTKDEVIRRADASMSLDGNGQWELRLSGRTLMAGSEAAVRGAVRALREELVKLFATEGAAS